MKGFKIKGLNAQSLKTAGKTAIKFVEKNAPAVCAGVAIAAMVSAVVTAIKHGPACKAELEEALAKADAKKNEKALKERMEDGNESTPIVNLTFKEKAPIYVKVCGKHYLKTFVAMVIAIVCVCASVHIGNKETRKYAILAAAAEASLSDLQNVTKDVVGEKKFNEIKDKLVGDKMEGSIPQNPGDVVETGQGAVLCYEPWYGVWFKGDPMAIRIAFGHFKDGIRDFGNGMMEDFYESVLHIPSDRIPKKAKKEGYHCDPDQNLKYLPSIPDRFKFNNFIIDGKETPVCIIGINEEPKSYEQMIFDKLPSHERDQLLFRVFG